MTHRRAFLTALAAAAGSALSAPVWAALKAGVRGAPIPRGRAGEALSARQAVFVDRVSDRIIPRTDTPGAADVGVVGFIDHMLAGYHTPASRKTFLEALDAMMERARQTLLGGDFVSADTEAQLAFLQREDLAAYADDIADHADSRQPFFRELKQLVLVGYCTSEAGATQELEYLPVPGGFKPSISVTPETRNYAI